LKEGESVRSLTRNFTSGYRGSVYLKKNGGRWLLINQVDIEDYIAGVLGQEMGPDWPMEALKAQAVCARTVARVKRDEARTRGAAYDITLSHQLYGQCEHENVVAAVEETQGQVLTFEGKPVMIFFHTCCGGATTTPENVWSGTIQPCWTAVASCSCSNSPYATWQRTFTRDFLSRVFQTHVRTFQINQTDSAGRALTITLVGSTGKELKMTAAEFRSRINSRAGTIFFNNQLMLPSTFFTLRQDGENFFLQGRGYGHGVGLCQWGARRMAEAGANYAEILHFYFPLLEITPTIKKEDYGNKDSFQNKS